MQLSRDVDCQRKTTLVLSYTLREAMAAEVEGAVLDDLVEMDGTYFGGQIRPADKIDDRIDRRLAKRQTGTRRAWSSFVNAAVARFRS